MSNRGIIFVRISDHILPSPTPTNNSNNPFPLLDPTPYAVGLQPQYTAVQQQFTSIQPQFTSFNPYQQQMEQEAAQVSRTPSHIRDRHNY